MEMLRHIRVKMDTNYPEAVSERVHLTANGMEWHHTVFHAVSIPIVLYYWNEYNYTNAFVTFISHII